MQLTHFYHKNRLYNHAQHPDFQLFELSIWLHTIASSLISVFVPIFLLNTGYSIKNIVFYYVIYNLLDIPFNFLAKYLVTKTGARRVMILGTLVKILFFVILGTLSPHNFLMLVILAFLAALYDTSYWVSHVYIFYEASNKEHLNAGKSVGGLQAIRQFGSLVGPLVGAFLLLRFGESILIYVSVAIFAFSILPLSKLKHVKDIPTQKGMSLKSLFASIVSKRNFFSTAFLGLNSEVADTLWVIFLYTIYGTVESVAVVPILTAATTIFFAKMAGNFSNKHSTKMILFGCTTIAITWVLRLTVVNFIFDYASIFFIGLFTLFISIPLDRSIVTNSIEVGPLESSTYRNTFSMLLRAPLYLVLFYSVNTFNTSFILAFIAIFMLFIIQSQFVSARGCPRKT